MYRYQSCCHMVYSYTGLINGIINFEIFIAGLVSFELSLTFLLELFRGRPDETLSCILPFEIWAKFNRNRLMYDSFDFF